MASSKLLQNGNGNRDFDSRINRLEVDVKALATQLEGYAAHTSQAIEQLAKRFEGSRPPWIGIASVALVVIGLCAGLAASYVTGQTRPLEGNIAHLAELIDLQIAARNRELQLGMVQNDREMQMRDEINALQHSALDRRVTGIEDRLRTRMSDSDDRQDAQTTALQKEIDLIRNKNP